MCVCVCVCVCAGCRLFYGMSTVVDYFEGD